MGKAAIIIVTASVLLGSVYAFGAKEDVRSAEARLSTHQYEILARNAALAGYNMAKQELADDFATPSPTSTGTYEGGDYDVSIALSGAIAKVKSTGTIAGPEGEEISFTVEAEIEKEMVSSVPDEAPPFMSYAMFAEDDLNLGGSLLYDLYVDGNEENTLNANMHTNGNLSLSGNAATVRGFGTYVGATSGSHLTSAFDPYYNPTNDDVIQRVPEVEAPTFDMADFLSKTIVDQSTSGDVNLNGSYNFGGTREDPYVWHIDGTLAASGGVVLEGYIMFLVDGDIELSGNVHAGDSGFDGGDESSIAYYASGGIDLGGNSKVYGQLLAGTSVNFLHGTPKVYGSAASLGSVGLSGTPEVYYRVPSPALTTIFGNPEFQLKLISYSEW